MISRLASIRGSLGPPAYEAEDVLIYKGDSLALMAKLQDSPFNLTVTSPPYNIGKEYETALNSEAYLGWCETWIAEIFRLTAEHGAFWLNLGYFSLHGKAKAIPIAYLLWNRIPFYLLQEVVWQYGAGVASRLSFSPRNEKFLWYVKNPGNYTFCLDAVRDPNVKYPNQKKNGKLKCNPLGKNPGDVWYFPKVTSGKNRSSKERTCHPAQFPVAVIDRIVKACSLPGDVIFDPFLGSGTVVEVAIQNKRKVVGFELSDRYVSTAVDRVEKALSRAKYIEAQGVLFPAV
ncbi:MAG TPA: site-specific DNA-methyltransferase [Planctomycetota bacterium]